MRFGLRRSLFSGAATASLLLAVGLVAQVPAHADVATNPTITCSDVNVPVSVLALPATVHGTLCLPAGPVPATVQVLVPGATYNETYWNFPYDPSVYNFRLAMNNVGYATFTLDRLGTGGSSRPLSALVTSSVQANAVHQVIQALRAGDVDGVSFGKVLIGGHSLGSIITVLEAGTYHDVDGVLLTGFSHQLGLESVAGVLVDSLRPADLDPAFAGSFYDPGYLTTAPGTRAADFYYSATTDPAVLATDEATKDVLSAAEITDGVGVSVVLPSTLAIQAPVLLVNGDHDGLFCLSATGNCASAAALATQEAPYFTPAACLQTFVLPGSGHDVNLATNTQLYQQQVVSWANEFVGTAPGHLTPPAGACSA